MTKKTSYAHGEFSWVDLMAHDMEAAKELYGELFGWTALPQDTSGGSPYVQFALDGEVVAGLGEMTAEMKAQGIPPMWNSYVNVEDGESAMIRAAELGAVITVPLMKVMDAGWLGYFQDPSGAHVAVWQKGEHLGAALVNAPGSFAWNELATRRVDKAKDFYAELFGWQYQEMPMEGMTYHLIKNDGRDNGGILPMSKEWGEVPPHWMVYFAVADTDATVEKLGALGGKVTVPATDTPVGRFAVVSDPQGAVFSVIALADPPK